MEKEQKKLLLVAVSVGVFLLVTITVAIILINQRTQPQDAGITWNAPQPVQVSPIPLPVTVVPAETNIDNDATEPCEQDEVIAFDINDGENLIIRIPSPTAAAIPDTPEVVTVTPRPVPAPVAPARATDAPATTSAPRVQPAPARTTQPVARTTAPAARSTPSRTVNDYWIQTGAFTARVRAEDAKETLAEKGLVSIIENREINGQIWYRVRLGPYTSQREADYWLALVKSIDGFGESQVRQTTRVQ